MDDETLLKIYEERGEDPWPLVIDRDGIDAFHDLTTALRQLTRFSAGMVVMKNPDTGTDLKLYVEVIQNEETH